MKFELIVNNSIPPPARNLANLVKGLARTTEAESARHIHDGLVKVNGRIRTQPHFKLAPGDRIEVEFTPKMYSETKRGSSARPQLKIVFEDDDLIVVEKPAGLLTVPTKLREKSNLQAMIDKYLHKRNENATCYCVQRLDRGVSGVLVFAKSLQIAESLRDQFAARKPHRRYVAIVSGQMRQTSGKYESYLTTDSELNQYSTRNAEEGKLAITHFVVTRIWESATMLEVRLETGRRNQIRVHFAEAGHPILGDPRYQRHLAVHPLWNYDRLALHAESLSIAHPRTGQQLSFTSSWPDEFREFQRRLNKRQNI